MKARIHNKITEDSSLSLQNILPLFSKCLRKASLSLEKKKKKKKLKKKVCITELPLSENDLVPRAFLLKIAEKALETRLAQKNDCKRFLVLHQQRLL